MLQYSVFMPSLVFVARSSNEMTTCSSRCYWQRTSIASQRVFNIYPWMRDTMWDLSVTVQSRIALSGGLSVWLFGMHVDDCCHVPCPLCEPHSALGFCYSAHSSGPIVSSIFSQAISCDLLPPLICSAFLQSTELEAPWIGPCRTPLPRYLIATTTHMDVETST